jgi:hypothetical protein
MVRLIIRLNKDVVSQTNSAKRWYFDVVSTSSQNESVDIVFYNTGPIGFPGGYDGGPLSVGVSGSFTNGTLFDYQVPATVKAVLTEDRHGLTGDWQGTGAFFRGSNLLDTYIAHVIEINSSELGVFGNLTLHSVGQASHLFSG